MRESVKLWVEALRSGDYQQGRGYLWRDGRFCVLGVAVDLYMKHVRKIPTGLGNPMSGEDTRNRILPSEVQGWLGLSSPIGALRDPQIRGGSLATLNDLGFDFSELADWIEESPERMFDGYKKPKAVNS